MKIAYVTLSQNVKGGQERFIYETSLRLLNRGHDVMVFCSELNLNEAYPELSKIPHKVFPSRKNFFGFFQAYFGLKAIKKIIFEAVKWEPDIIFLNLGFAYLKYFQKVTESVLIPYVHYPETFRSYKKNILRNIYRRILNIRFLEATSFQYAKIVLANSNYTSTAIKKLAYNANIHVIYPAIDNEKFVPTWKDKGYIYYHSRFQSNKNQLLAIQAVGKKHPLILSGFVSKQDEEYFSQILKEASKYGHKVIQNISDIEMLSLLQNCSLFLFPSIGEHFGIAPIEAMACGKPIIAHNSGGTRETVGKVGILCGDDPEEWRRNISFLMNHPKIRREYAKKSYALSKEFNWEKTVNEMIKVFKEVKSQ